jgi:spore germination cell wall hydrolase CwlJ-like protein
MHRLIAWLLFSAAVPSYASDPVQCVAEVLYSEARGAALEELVLVGNTLKNWHDSTGEPVCKVADKGYTRKPVPAKVAAVYQTVARGILSGEIPDTSVGADRFNEGKKPAYPGLIRRQTRHFTFYTLKKGPTYDEHRSIQATKPTDRPTALAALR